MLIRGRTYSTERKQWETIEILPTRTRIGKKRARNYIILRDGRGGFTWQLRPAQATELINRIADLLEETTDA